MSCTGGECFVTVLTLDEIKLRREFNYRRTPERRMRTVEEARAFVEEVGFCHFWPIKGVKLPNRNYSPLHR